MCVLLITNYLQIFLEGGGRNIAQKPIKVAAVEYFRICMNYIKVLKCGLSFSSLLIFMGMGAVWDWEMEIIMVPKEVIWFDGLDCWHLNVFNTLLVYVFYTC